MVFLPAFALALAIFPAEQPGTDYKTLIDEYLTSGSARVPHVLTEWPYEMLNNALTEVLAPHPDAPFYPVVSLEALIRWLQAAALAHVEAARVSLQSTRPRASGFIHTGRTLIERLRTVISHSRSLRPGREATTSALDAGETFAARWLAAGGVLLQGTNDLAGAYQNFRAAVDAYPRDAELRLGLGTAIEMAATSSHLTVLANSGSVADPRQAARNYRLALLSDAEAQLTAALNLDPALHEARVRLGRILLLRGRRTEAAAALETVRAARLTPALSYLACTLLARLEHEAGNAAGAERMYREALSAWPDGQRAAVGLSHASWLQRRPVSAEFMRREGDVRRPDPWASYTFGQHATLDRRIAELRQVVWP